MLHVTVYRQKDVLCFPILQLCFGIHMYVIFQIQTIQTIAKM